MEAERRSSMRRKPLSDCTNTLTAVYRRKNSSPTVKSSALIKPPKTSDNSAINNPKPLPNTSNSLKSHTSIGSNNFQNNPSVPPTHLSHAGGRDHRISSPAYHNHRQDAKTGKDKGKMVLETPVIVQGSDSSARQSLGISSSATSNCSLSAHPAFPSEKLDSRSRKDKGKMILEPPKVPASDPSAPHALLVSTSAASGTHDLERLDFLTVYNQRTTPHRRKHAGGQFILPFSCPPQKRTKKMGVELDDKGGDDQSGSRTDPLPGHKKRSHSKGNASSMHGMPQDEVEKLRAYYADIDAFNLPEEVASESDLD